MISHRRNVSGELELGESANPCRRTVKFFGSEKSPDEVCDQQEHCEQEETDPKQKVGGEFWRVDLLLVHTRDNTRPGWVFANDGRALRQRFGGSQDLQPQRARRNTKDDMHADLPAAS